MHPRTFADPPFPLPTLQMRPADRDPHNHYESRLALDLVFQVSLPVLSRLRNRWPSRSLFCVPIDSVCTTKINGTYIDVFDEVHGNTHASAPSEWGTP